jgi:hypothetical protein
MIAETRESKDREFHVSWMKFGVKGTEKNKDSAA